MELVMPGFVAHKPPLTEVVLVVKIRAVTYSVCVGEYVWAITCSMWESTTFEQSSVAYVWEYNIRAVTYSMCVEEYNIWAVTSSMLESTSEESPVACVWECNIRAVICRMCGRV